MRRDRRHFRTARTLRWLSRRFGRAGSRLILLGTAGGPTPKKTRSGPSQIIVIGDRGYVSTAATASRGR